MGRCRFKPVLGSPCRYFGRLDLGLQPCYLRTYTHLFNQHERLVFLSEMIGAAAGR